MERRGLGRPRKNYDEDVIAIEKRREMYERMERRLKEEDEIHERLEQRMEEEKAKMREERDQGIRPAKLGEEQRKIRKMISQARFNRTKRLLKQQEIKADKRPKAIESRGKRPEGSLSGLTKEERNCRSQLLHHRRNQRKREEARRQGEMNRRRQLESKNIAVVVEDLDKAAKETSNNQPGQHQEPDPLGPVALPADTDKLPGTTSVPAAVLSNRTPQHE